MGTHLGHVDVLHARHQGLQARDLHALAHALNQHLGSQAVSYGPTPQAGPTDQAASLQALIQAMQAGEVQQLLILGANPVYHTPAFAEALKRVPTSVHLGLYADEGLQHVGVSASFTAARRAELIEELQPLVVPIEEHPWGRWQEFLTANPDRVPGTQSRWSQGKDLSFTPLRPERVLEVAYDHMEGRRFRHTAQFRRWRPDRDPESCGYDQLEEPVSYDLTRILGVD